MDTPLLVHVWSDVACPWCYLGKRRFERGVRAYGGEVVVEYHAFELAPDTPVDFDGSEVDFLVEHKRMPRDQVAQMLDRMTALGAEEGLKYDFSAVRHTKTLLAHQAIHHAKAHGRQDAMVDRLFGAYFEDGRHIGRVDDLVTIGEEAGLDPGELRAALEDGRYREGVAQDIDAARRLGINGVPFYVVDGRYGISGAQSPEVFAATLQRAADENTAGARSGEPGPGH